MYYTLFERKSSWSTIERFRKYNIHVCITAEAPNKKERTIPVVGETIVRLETHAEGLKNNSNRGTKILLAYCHAGNAHIR